MKRLLITTGDPDGIGSEVTSKALAEIGPRPGFQFVLYRSGKTPLADLRRLDKRFRRRLVPEEELWPKAHSVELLEIVSDRPAARWVESATRLCLEKRASGLVTAPLSKRGIARAGLRDLGHTEIFKRLCRTRDLYMGFCGRHFNVLLVTDHVPLTKVPRQLTLDRVRRGIKAAVTLKKISGRQTPIAWVGLNPHAGEGGLLGKEEARWQRLFSRAGVVGPLVPDAAFLEKNWNKFSVFISPYHDQGLIPFKMAHGFDEGVHVTLGLPFVRTSVDHGTAKELFGKGVAEHGSMREAIKLAIRLIQRQKLPL